MNVYATRADAMNSPDPSKPQRRSSTYYHPAGPGKVPSIAATRCSSPILVLACGGTRTERALDSHLLRDIAARKQATPAQIALAWLLARKPWITPIPGTRKLTRLDENIGATEIDLTADDLRDIETAGATVPIHGARYPEHLEQQTGH